MELLIEGIELNLVDNLVEQQEGKDKQYYLYGIFMQAEVKNRNGRIYPRPINEFVVANYQDKILNRRAIGELNHPTSRSQIDYKEVCHRVVEMKMDGNNTFAKSLIIKNTPNGNIVAGLMDAGVKIGTSSRGLGRVVNGVVQNGYQYICNDIVYDPSAPEAFVEAVYESNKQWVLENGILIEKEIEQFDNKRKVLKSEQLVEFFNGWLKLIKKDI